MVEYMQKNDAFVQTMITICRNILDNWAIIKFINETRCI